MQRLIWIEERLLELATIVVGDANHQAAAAGSEATECTIPKKLLQHHTHRHHHWSSGVILSPSRLLSLQLGVLGWVMRTTMDWTPSQRRKLSIELAGKRAALGRDGCEDGALAFVRARSVVTTMRASDKVDSRNIREALQILQTNARAQQTRQTAVEVH